MAGQSDRGWDRNAGHAGEVGEDAGQHPGDDSVGHAPRSPARAGSIPGCLIMFCHIVFSLFRGSKRHCAVWATGGGSEDNSRSRAGRAVMLGTDSYWSLVNARGRMWGHGTGIGRGVL